MKFIGDTSNEEDFEYMRALLSVKDKMSDSKITSPPAQTAPTQQALDFPKPSVRRRPNELVITNQQAASLMGLKVANIRRNHKDVPGYSSIITPHPQYKGHWIVGEELTKEMRDEHRQALEAGVSLRVPRVLPTQVINRCIGTINPQDPPKYKPHVKSQVRDAKVFSFVRKDTNMSYNLTLIDNWENSQSDWYMGIENHFLKKSFKRP